MKISVLMAAYNGEKFIYDQLKSIYMQKKRPDEVIICDDCSTDNTIQVIESFKNDFPNIDIKVFANEKNMGYAANFFRASTLSTGDLVFFSDQDDIWLPDKISMMSEQFENNKKIGGLICDYEIIDENSKVIGRHKKDPEKVEVINVSFNKMVRTFSCGGLNFALLREYVDNYRNFIIENGLSHDVPLGIIISSKGRLYRINQTFVQHRVHSNNATNPEYGILNRLGNVEKQIKAARNKLKWLEKCRPAVLDTLSDTDSRFYDLAIDFYKKTTSALEHRNAWILIKLCFQKNYMIDKRIAIFNVFTVLMPRRGKSI